MAIENHRTAAILMPDEHRRGADRGPGEPPAIRRELRCDAVTGSAGLCHKGGRARPKRLHDEGPGFRSVGHL